MRGEKSEFLNVKASSGNGHLGGEDFDNLLVEYCI
jgi:molecular chaperone DnaK (HSP70)